MHTPAANPNRSAEHGAANAVIDGMADYYVRRAAYYERVYHKPERQADLRAMEAWIAAPFEGRHVLEVACGTGWWTPHAALRARSWLATDLAEETLAVARAKALPACVRLACADAYTLEGLAGQTFDAAFAGERFDAAFAGERFDAAFAGCWWSHVPLARLPGWLELLHSRLAPGARVVFLDNSFVQNSSTPISRRDADGNTYQNRVLDDGSVHEVLKNFPDFDQARALLGPRAVDARWIAYTHYWILSYTLS